MAVDESYTHLNQMALRRQLTLAYTHNNELREVLEKVGVLDFPSESPKSLLRLLWKVAEAYEEKLGSFDRALRTPLTVKDAQYLSMRIVGVASAGVQLAKLARYVEAASVENVPWGLYGQLQRLCKKIDPNVQLIVRRSWEFKYEFIEAKSEIRRATKTDFDIETILKDYPRYMILSFPITERHNMLKNAVWGHEVGHVLQQNLGQDQDEQAPYFDKDFATDELGLASLIAEKIQISDGRIDRLVNQTILDLGIGNGDSAENKSDLELRKEIKNDLYHRVSDTKEKWVTEIVCDLLGIRLFGPAALFAFCEFVEPLFNLSISDDTHPCPAIRMKIMIDELQTLGYVNLENPMGENGQLGKYQTAFERDIALIKEISENALKQHSRASTQERQMRYEIIQEALDSNCLDFIRSNVRSSDGKYFLDPKKLMLDVPQIIRNLDRDIPANKIELTDKEPSPASLVTILNAGWIYWIDLLHNHQSSTEEFRTSNKVIERDRVNKLVLKGIEASEIQLQFAERQAMQGILLKSHPDALF